jgi:hypothetical protein
MANFTTNTEEVLGVWKGGGATLIAHGTWGGATISVQASLDQGATRVTLASLTGNGNVPFNVNDATTLYLVCSGGTGHNIYAQARPSEGANNINVGSGLAQDSTLSNLLTEMQGHAPGTSAEPVVVEDGGSLFDPNITTFNAVDINTAAVSLGSPTAGQYAVLSDLLISCDADCTVSLYSTSETLALLKVKADGTSVQYTPRAKVKSTVANERIKLRANAAANATITSLTYNEA